LATRASKKIAKKASVTTKGSITKKALVAKAPHKSARPSAPKGAVPNSVTVRALIDATVGRVVRCANVDDMFAKAGVQVEKS
jgi:hypothetical protein